MLTLAGLEDVDCGLAQGNQMLRNSKDYNKRSGNILQEQSLSYQQTDKENYDWDRERDRHKPMPNSRTSPAHVRRDRDSLMHERDWDVGPKCLSNPGNNPRDLHTPPRVESNQSVSIYDLEPPQLEASRTNGMKEDRMEYGEANLIDLRSSDGGANSVNSGVDIGRDGSSPLYELHHRRKGQSGLNMKCWFDRKFECEGSKKQRALEGEPHLIV